MKSRAIDLTKSLGVPFYLESDKIKEDSYLKGRHVEVLIDRIISQLINDEITSPSHLYQKYVRLDHDNEIKNTGFRVDIYKIDQNMLGIEYIKTVAQKDDESVRIVEVLSGGGIILMQKYSRNSTDAIVARVKKEAKVVIPAGYTATFINNKNTPFILLEVKKDESETKRVLDDMKGLAYYVIKKNARAEIVLNPNYREAPRLRRIKWDNILSKFKITAKTPLLKQIIRKHEKIQKVFENPPAI